MEQFCSDTFGTEEQISVDYFYNIIKDAQNTSLEKYLNNVKDSSVGGKMSLYPEITISAMQKPDPKSLIIVEEPDYSQRGAYFNSDGECHRYSLTLATASECSINLFVDSDDTVLSFLIVRNQRNIEGIGNGFFKNSKFF